MDQFFIEIYESIVYQWIVMNQNTYKKVVFTFILIKMILISLFLSVMN